MKFQKQNLPILIAAVTNAITVYVADRTLAIVIVSIVTAGAAVFGIDVPAKGGK